MSSLFNSRIRISKDYLTLRNQFNGVLISDDFQIDANGDYSTTPKTFRLNSGLPGVLGRKVVLTEMFINMGMIGNPSLNGFGSGVALTNGIDYQAEARNSALNIANFKTNLEIFRFSSSVQQTILQGNNNFIKLPFDFYKSHDLLFDFSQGDDIVMTFNDNMSLVVNNFTTFVLGYYVDSPIKSR